MTEESLLLFDRIISIWVYCEIALILLVSLLIISDHLLLARMVAAIVISGIVLFDYLLDEERSFGVKKCFSNLWEQKVPILLLLLVLQPLILTVVLQIMNHLWFEP